MSAPAATPVRFLVEVEEVSTRFGEHLVHDGISLAVERGEILGVVGGSGSGKTTLLLEMIGLLRPTSGSVRLFGRPWPSPDLEERRASRARCGVLFQGGALFSALTVYDNIALPLRESGLDDEDLVERLVLLKLKMVGLDASAAFLKPAELSGGMTKRAGLARALVLDPELLFLDEPTSGLDPSAGEAFVALVKSLHRDLGLTLVLVTHDLDSVNELCDRVAFLSEGRLVALGSVEAVLASEDTAARRFFHGERVQRIFGERRDRD